MNKILTYGFALVGLAALFWACGSGEVAVYTPEDEYMEFALDGDDDGSALRGLVNQAISAYCEGDLNRDACLAATRPDDSYVSDTTSPDSSSSSRARSSSSFLPASSFNPFGNNYSSFNPFGSTSSSSRPGMIPVYSSSSRPGMIPVYSSSSRPGMIPVLSSSSKVFPRSSSSIRRSSSSKTVVIGSSSLPENVPWGTCVANSGQPGSRGVPLKWKFTMSNTLFGGNVRAMMNSSFEWEFDDAEPSSYSGTGSAGLTSTDVTYAESGKFAARATMTYNGQSQKVECDSVEVMGYPITGCKCTPDKDEVDVAKESVASGATVVKWTVSKCTSEDKTFSYEWEKGMTGDGASATKTLDEKIVYAPDVTVRNSDNGVLKVSCDPVKTIDSDHPEFEFKAQNTKIAMPAGESTVYFNMQPGWHNNDGGNCTFSCQVPTGGLLTVTINNQTKTDYYVPMGIPISSTTGMTPMKVTLSVAAECMLGW